MIMKRVQLHVLPSAKKKLSDVKLRFIPKEKLRKISSWTVAVHKRTRHAAVVDARSHRAPRMLTLHFLWTGMIERSPASRQLLGSSSAASEKTNISGKFN